MAVPLTVLDAFTNRPFAGNPAAVCRLERPADPAWMQSVAAELGLSETAFLVPRADGDHDLAWFTPTVEVDLCGHATLASAHVLGGSARFHTRSGVLTCTPGLDGTIDIDLPADPVTPIAAVATAPADWAVALGLAPARVLAASVSASSWALVEVAEAADVRAATPDAAAVVALGGAVIVVADTVGDRDEATDAVSRAFVPGAGIAEDPVTGSAHCVIGPWLAARHHRPFFTGHQASARGGRVGMRPEGDRVVISGHVVTISRGTLLADPPG